MDRTSSPVPGDELLDAVKVEPITGRGAYPRCKAPTPGRYHRTCRNRAETCPDHPKPKES
jgi:hypothetical protein